MAYKKIFAYSFIHWKKEEYEKNKVHLPSVVIVVIWNVLIVLKGKVFVI